MVEETPGERFSADQWRLIRRVAAVAYLLTVAGIVVAVGVPTGRASLMTIIVVGVAVASLGRGRNALGRVVLDWLPFTLVLMAYDFSRGLAHVVGMPLQERGVAAAESWLFGGTVPSVWLQQHFYTPTSVHWYDAVATLIYTTHFLATPVLAAVLWLRDRGVWVCYVRRVVVLSMAGVLTYVLFPEAPPWLAARDQVIGPVARLSARGWIWLHFNNLQALLAEAQRGGSNPTAAMPSIHAALATLVALFIATRLRSRWRWLLALYPVAMGLTLVYTGEHYVLDVVVGVLYAVAVHVLVTRWERSRAVSEPSVAAAREAVFVG